MIEWHELSTHDGDHETHYLGKGMKSWASADTWDSLRHTFAGFDVGESWSGLIATMDLFRHLGHRTAEILGFLYPEDVDRNLTDFIFHIKN